jgi:hypothetical protein
MAARPAVLTFRTSQLPTVAPAAPGVGHAGRQAVDHLDHLRMAEAVVDRARAAPHAVSPGGQPLLPHRVSVGLDREVPGAAAVPGAEAASPAEYPAGAATTWPGESPSRNKQVRRN